ncbi:MAG: DUF3899 domain-containing protein, partial [Eubacteriaceae bacterium]|nr:DUF3899 domain-containing protein [Eubacteriaceae bacterium]
GLVFAVWYTLSRRIFSSSTAKEVFFCLCDATFIPAAFFIGSGMLLYVVNSGFFDAFTYSFRRFSFLFKKDFEDRMKKDQSFQEYKEERHKDPFSPKPLLLVGFGFFLVSTVFLVLYFNT